MDLEFIEWDNMGSMVLAQGKEKWRALAHAVMNLQVP
jgi:hypothetical protein